MALNSDKPKQLDRAHEQDKIDFQMLENIWQWVIRLLIQGDRKLATC